ncbi:MAG: YdcH family protein [Hyphomonadaceae bacterium]
MALESRIRELDARHRDLDQAIMMEARRPAMDAIRLTEMKRQKLKIKEEIESLRTQGHH